MSDEKLIMALAKLMIAAAWVDGEPTLEEINSMKDLLYRLPQVSALQWASIEIYIEDPVDEAERARLLADLRYAIRSAQDRQLVLDTLDDLVQADGQVTEEEQAVIAEITSAIDGLDLGPLSRLVRGSIGRRSQAVADAPNREEYLDDFRKNKVYYGMRRGMDQGEFRLDYPEDVLRTLSLAGGMMAQIARVNPEISDDEVATMVDALQTHWHLTADQAAFVADVAVSQTAHHMDRHRLARQFAGVCTPEERAAFLDVLFAVAAADGMASYKEIEEIRQISRSLKLSNEQFIDAKLKLPRDRRAQ